MEKSSNVLKIEQDLPLQKKFFFFKNKFFAGTKGRVSTDIPQGFVPACQDPA